MLTKDLLKYRNRNGRLTPTFLKEKSCDLADLLAAFAEAKGRPIGELEDDLKTCCPVDAPGLVKLLLDRCEVKDDDGTIAIQRWQALRASQKLRQEAPSNLTAAEFDKQLSLAIGVSSETLRELLYSDLPDSRQVLNTQSTSSDWLVHRYNVALVQGLLLRAKDVTFTVHKPSILEARSILRHMRFHRLLAKISRTPDELTLTVSGPLSIFEQAQTYGMHIARFFPHVIKLPKWHVHATLQIGSRELQLNLDQSAGLHSHYKQDSGYIPEEMTSFVTAFNKRYAPWTAMIACDVINLGCESYSVTDLEFKGPNGEVKYLEIFHHWHQGGLSHRLTQLERHPNSGLMLAVCQKFGRSKVGQELLARSEWFTKNGCFFGSFPTPKAVWALVN